MVEDFRHQFRQYLIKSDKDGLPFTHAQRSFVYQRAKEEGDVLPFGSISAHAVLALNKGARLGGFYHDTGEGGISRYHLEHGGDLVFEMGTGYFGCRDEDGNFDPATFRDKARLDQVKMAELKLSPGAKPGGGGVLPREK